MSDIEIVEQDQTPYSPVAEQAFRDFHLRALQIKAPKKPSTPIQPPEKFPEKKPDLTQIPDFSPKLTQIA
jgi:hypothetical protein